MPTGLRSRRKKMSATANEVLQEALDVLEKYVPADTEDGAVIEKVSNAIRRFKANSRKQIGDTNGQD